MLFLLPGQGDVAIAVNGIILNIKSVSGVEPGLTATEGTASVPEFS